MKSISQLIEFQLRADYPYDEEYTLTNVLNATDKVTKKYKAVRKE